MSIWEGVVAITRVLSARGAQLVVAIPIAIPFCVSSGMVLRQATGHRQHLAPEERVLPRTRRA
jgi:hypothetical protein